MHFSGSIHVAFDPRVMLFFARGRAGVHSSILPPTPLPPLPPLAVQSREGLFDRSEGRGGTDAGKKTMNIQGKLLLAMTAVLALVTLFGLAYHRSLLTVRDRLLLLENIDDLGVAASDMRRAEKNYLLYHDESTRRAWIAQVDLTRRAIQEKTAEMTKLAGAAYCEKLTSSISAYAALAQDLVSSRGGEADAEKTRAQGQKVYEYSRGIVRAERERMDAMIRVSHRIFLVSLFVILVAGLTGALLIARNIVAPLRKIEKATRQASEGTYATIDGVFAHDEIGKLVMAFNHMVKQIEEHQEELVQSGKLASIGTLTSGVAHELNNPLNNISMIAQTYLHLYDSLGDKERLDFMSQIDAQCERARDIVVNLLDFSRVRPRTFAVADIGRVVKESLKLVENQLAMNNIECVLKMPEGLPSVHVNANRIKQVLINVLTNAIQAMPKGGRLTVEVALAGDLHHVNVAITDTGVGIPPEVLPRIFDPFFTTNQVGQGTGLGLSVSYGIIKRHGGTLSVRSEPGKGSTFTVALPVLEEESDDGEQAQDTGRR
jgi:two-component system, NtrC family, sensor kinase